MLRGLCDGDPLGMAERCARHLRRRGLLLDPARLLPLALARAAHDAPQRDRRSDLDAYLERSIARATRQLLRRELEEERAGLADSQDPHLARLVELLDLEPALARLAMLHLNSLPRPVRLAFCALFLDGESPADHAARAGTTVPRVLGHARLALRVIAGCGRVDARDARAWGRALTSDGEEACRG